MSCFISIVTDSDVDDWNNFAKSNSNYNAFDFNWRGIFSQTFGHEPFYLIARDSKNLTIGIAPIFFVNSILFGKAFISLPYLNGGGILAKDAATYSEIYNFTADEAKRRGARYVELRHREQPSSLPTDSICRSHKVSMLLELGESSDDVFNKFSAKLRSQIRRPTKSGASSLLVSGDQVTNSQLADFYSVFSQNMKDLGTPVYPLSLFKNTLKAFGERSHLCIVSFDKEPIAAGITVDWQGATEIPWASSLRSHNKISANMLLYWTLIEASCNRQCAVFDFGRSTPDSGPYKFKKQWGAKPLPLNWIYQGKEGEIPNIDPNSKKFSLMVSAWRKLPLPVTTTLGPYLTKSLP